MKMKTIKGRENLASLLPWAFFCHGDQVMEYNQLHRGTRPDSPLQDPKSVMQLFIFLSQVCSFYFSHVKVQSGDPGELTTKVYPDGGQDFCQTLQSGRTLCLKEGAQ